MTEVLYGLDTAKRERVAALRAQGDFYWLDASLSETTLEERDSGTTPMGGAGFEPATSCL